MTCQAFACWKFGMVPNSPMAPMGVGILGMFLIYRLQVLPDLRASMEEGRVRKDV